MAAVGLNFLMALLGYQQGNRPFLVAGGRQAFIRDKHPGQLAAVFRQFLGVGHPRAAANGLKTPRIEGIELGHGGLLIENLGHFGGALRGQAQAQPGHQTGNTGGRYQGVGGQALLADAGGRQHGHLAVEVQAPVGQQHAQEQAEGQNQLKKARQFVGHDQKQHRMVQTPFGGLGQVLDETPAHDDDQQHRTDGAGGQQQLSGQITEHDQSRHSRVVRLGRLRSN